MRRAVDDRGVSGQFVLTGSSVPADDFARHTASTQMLSCSSPTGRWGAFEVKLGAGLVDDGAAALLRFRESIHTRRSGEPSVLGVIAGTGFGYVRPDGIAVMGRRGLAAPPAR